MLTLAFAVLLPVMPQADQTFRSFTKGECTQFGAIQRCEGGVVATYRDIRVEADWIQFDSSTQILTAGDQGRFVRGEQDVRFGRITYNVDTQSGELTNVSGRIEGFFVEAEQTERLADGRYHLVGPSATACTGDCPAWGFTWKEAWIRPGESVSGRNMVFRFHGVPVFYLPRFTIPVESKDRSSGFLIPATSTSTTKGRSLRQTFFWAINRSADATFTGEYFTKRGPSGTVDFRATPNERTRIDVSTFFAIDRLGQGGHRTSVRTFSDFGENWRGVANLDITSGFEFRQVYEEGFNLISSPVEESTAFLTNNGPRSSLNFLYNRTAVFFPDQPSVALQKFPSIDLQLPTNRLSRGLPVYFSFDGGFTGMSRRDSAIDTPGMMQRVDVHPSIRIPLVRSALLQWSHQLGVRDTFYTHSLRSGVVRDSLNRGSFDYTMHVTGPQIEKDFGSFRHIVEPTVEYRYVTGVDRFQETIVVDEADLVTDTNELEYGVTSRFFAGHEFLTWRIAQKMYFDPSFGGALLAGRRNTLQPLVDLTGFAFSDGAPRRFSPVVSTFRIATTPQTSTDIEVDYDTQREEFRSAGITGGLGRGPVNATVGYFFNKRSEIQSPSNQLRGLLSMGSYDRPGISAGFGFYYDIHRSLFQGSTAQVRYNADCYGLSFEFTQYDLGDRKESRLRFSLSLKNLGSLGTLRPQERLF